MTAYSALGLVMGRFHSLRIDALLLNETYWQAARLNREGYSPTKVCHEMFVDSSDSSDSNDYCPNILSNSSDSSCPNVLSNNSPKLSSLSQAGVC